MFLDPTRFPVSRQLESSFATFRGELDRLPEGLFQAWPLAESYQGTWQMFPLVLLEAPPGFVVDLARNRALCPGTWRRLQEIGRIRTACFSWLGPGAHIYAHTDAYYHRLVRLHLGLRVPAQSLMRVADELRSLEEGVCIVVDGQTPHEAANLSAQPRVTLLVDVEMSAAEEHYVLAVSPHRRRALDRHLRDAATTGPGQAMSPMMAPQTSHTPPPPAEPA
ncbi:MAG: aspartyl/asparaginyl beta-hydroxylase domain-containing protein [Planctomycetes bacterium]|nr:aspartyl/asparaginyl beta-hydroxylase domain-containing protein [Planctomycetota bacterium]